jgi:hypothetical protein
VPGSAAVAHAESAAESVFSPLMAQPVIAPTGHMVRVITTVPGRRVVVSSTAPANHSAPPPPVTTCDLAV